MDQENDFKELVQFSWRQFQSERVIPNNMWDKLRALKSKIKNWYLQKGAGDPLKISKFEEDIDSDEKRLLADQDNSSIRAMLVKKKDNLWALYRVKERFWLQKSRLKWLQQGNRNTKFFHLVASSRRNGNYINKLVEGGILVDKPSDIREVITQHFEKHFNNSQAVKVIDWSCNLRSLNVVSSVRLE